MTSSKPWLGSMSVGLCCDSRISAVLACVHSQPPRAIPTARVLAQKLDISEGYLRHKFKEVVGLSFGQYVRRLRFQRAKSLLESGDVGVKQAMLEVGILDHSSFAKRYKKFFGETATNTRRGSTAYECKLMLVPSQGADIASVKRQA